MNKATLQTWVRSALSSDPQTPEQITNYIQKRCSHEAGISVGKVTIILNQLENAGLCYTTLHRNPTSGDRTIFYFISKN